MFRSIRKGTAAAAAAALVVLSVVEKFRFQGWADSKERSHYCCRHIVLAPLIEMVGNGRAVCLQIFDP